MKLSGCSACCASKCDSQLSQSIFIELCKECTLVVQQLMARNYSIGGFLSTCKSSTSRIASTYTRKYQLAHSAFCSGGAL